MITEGHRNRMGNAKNPFQGSAQKVLCVCSAGLLRSPTAARVLANPPFNYNTRAAGISTEFALIPVDPVLLFWADTIVCMEQWQRRKVIEMLEQLNFDRTVNCLGISDNYEFNDPELQKMITVRCEELGV